MIDICLTSSILIIAVIFIRFVAKGRLYPVLQYALWLPVVIRLIIPIPLWSSKLSVLNLFPEDGVLNGTESQAVQGEIQAQDFSVAMNLAADQTQDLQGTVGDSEIKPGLFTQDGYKISAIGSNAPVSDHNREAMEKQSHNGEEGTVGEQQFASAGAAGEQQTVSAAAVGSGFLERLTGYLPYIWLLGILLTSGYMFVMQVRWKKYLYENREELIPGQKYRDSLSVYVIKGLPSPCLTGRSIYLTKDMAEDKKRLDHILAHEYCHYKHLDSLWVVVRCVLTSIYWFHPLVWLAAYLSKQDSELACDAAVIRLLGEEERIAYGRTLIKLISGDFKDRNRIGIASTMSGEENGIKKRISLIASKPRYAVAASAFVVLVLAGVVAVTFSGKVREEDKKNADTATDPAQVSLTQDSLAQSSITEAELSEEIAEEQTELEQLESLLEERQVLIQQMQEELKAQEQAFAEAVKAAEAAEMEELMTRLSSFDEKIGPWGSGIGIPDVKNQSEYVQDYIMNGESVLEEGLYLLQMKKGTDGSDIKVYGMYTKEYGCKGLKILIGETASDFALPWIVSGMQGMEENISVYEYAEDGMPKTFAIKMPIVNTSNSEIWELYFCDRDDTGVISLSRFLSEDYLQQMHERVDLEFSPANGQIYVNDNGEIIGTLGLSDASLQAITVNDIKEVILDGQTIGWMLGSKEEDMKLITAVGLELENGEVRYQGLNLISFPVDSGSLENRKFTLGRAEIDNEYIVAGLKISPEEAEQRILQPEMWQKPPMQEESDEQTLVTSDTLAVAFQSDGVHDKAALMLANPCPSYTRISDGFGKRTNPITGEVIVHNGVDLAAEEGSDIVAAAAGEVYQTGFDTKNGYYVVLYHSMSGEFTYYTSCKEILVSEGDKVSSGQKIAVVGQTGMSTGAHLHFALSRDGEYVKPDFF